MKELIRKILRERWDWDSLDEAVPVPNEELKKYILHSTNMDPRVIYNEGINPPCASDSKEWSRYKYPCVIFGMNGYNTIWGQAETQGAVVIDTTQLPNHKWWYDPAFYRDREHSKISVVTNEKIPSKAIKGIICLSDLYFMLREGRNWTDDEAQQFLDEVMIENTEEWSNDCMAKRDYVFKKWKTEYLSRMNKQMDGVTESRELIRKILKEWY